MNFADRRTLGYHLAAAHPAIRLEQRDDHLIIHWPNPAIFRAEIMTFRLISAEKTPIDPSLLKSVKEALYYAFPLLWPTTSQEEDAPHPLLSPPDPLIQSFNPLRREILRILREIWHRDQRRHPDRRILDQYWSMYRMPIQAGQDYSDPVVWEAFRKRVGLSA